MKHFEYDQHRSEAKENLAVAFWALAGVVDKRLPDGLRKDYVLHHLAEARDIALRAASGPHIGKIVNDRVVPEEYIPIPLTEAEFRR
jgi:hypothetical protein